VVGRPPIGLERAGPQFGKHSLPSVGAPPALPLAGGNNAGATRTGCYAIDRAEGAPAG